VNFSPLNPGKSNIDGGGAGKLLRPARRRKCIDQVRDKLGVSERRACRVLGQYRSTQRQIPQGREDEARLVADMIELARQYAKSESQSFRFASPKATNSA
jgi:hypothetical protein